MSGHGTVDSVTNRSYLSSIGGGLLDIYTYCSGNLVKYVALRLLNSESKVFEVPIT